MDNIRREIIGAVCYFNYAYVNHTTSDDFSTIRFDQPKDSRKRGDELAWPKIVFFCRLLSSSLCLDESRNKIISARQRVDLMQKLLYQFLFLSS